MININIKIKFEIILLIKLISYLKIMDNMTNQENQKI